MPRPTRLGDRLSHVHVADGFGGQNLDEHLIPGRGRQPVAELLEYLATTGYEGQLVLEVSTRKAPDRQVRMRELAEALAFTRLHFAPSSPGAAMGNSGDARERIALLRRRNTTAPRLFSVDREGEIDGESGLDDSTG